MTYLEQLIDKQVEASIVASMSRTTAVIGAIAAANHEALRLLREVQE